MDTKDIAQKEYEISFLLKDEGALSGVDSILSAEKAEVTHRGPVKEIRLEYPIKKAETAHFGFYHFRALPEAVARMNDALILKEGVLRFLIVTPPLATAQFAPRSEIRREPAMPSQPPASSGALSNEALEEKLEEILQ